jgi:hypothetical protein
VLARAGTKGLTTTALAKAISAQTGNKQLSTAITKLKSLTTHGSAAIGFSAREWESISRASLYLASPNTLLCRPLPAL